MIDPIIIPEALNNALQQRAVEVHGLMSLLRFAYSTNHEYKIPEEKIDYIYQEYMKTNTEYAILREMVWDFIPYEIPRTVDWNLDFDTRTVLIEGHTKEPESKKRKANPNGYDELLGQMYGYTEDFFRKKQIEVTFQVTEGCSLVCKYCYQHNKTPKVMSLDVGKKLVDVIFEEMQDTHYAIVLSFIGGEPLLQPQLISDIIDYWDYCLPVLQCKCITFIVDMCNINLYML